jgi:hypothetical protein
MALSTIVAGPAVELLQEADHSSASQATAQRVEPRAADLVKRRTHRAVPSTNPTG